jgi:hypothetical protein
LNKENNINPALPVSEIQAGIKAIKENAALLKEINFYSRTEAIDFIDFHIIYRVEGLLQGAGPNEDLYILKQRAEHLIHDLDKINGNLFAQLREKIKAGVYTKSSSFKKTIDKYMEYPVNDRNRQDNIGYDNLDVLINGLLFNQPIPEARTDRAAEMVFYQKTPARIIFQLAESVQLRPDDAFFDLGSGLGQVAILMHLLTGATAKGIEYEPAFCNYAKECAAQLNLFDVEFINADARDGNYAEGTIFFMYTPFEGQMMLDMLEILKMESSKRTIRIFTYGPCSPHVARQNWLNCINGNADDPYQLYEFISSGSTPLV